MRAVDGSKRKNRRAKILKLAKGFKGDRKSNFKPAKDAVVKALDHAYSGRKLKKRDYRSLWIARINAAARQNDISYSKLMHGLKLAGVDMNRKMLADIAYNDSKTFAQLAETAKKALN